MNKANKSRFFLTLSALAKNAQTGWLMAGNQRFLCQIGRSGRSSMKREGDDATPLGIWPVVQVYYRADRVARPRTALPMKIIQPNQGWCDAPLDRNYNRPVSRPYDASTEQLWREDHAYDLLVVLDYNFTARSLNRGSAIFLHLAHDDHRATAGCLAFAQKDLRMILKRLKAGDRIFMG